MPTYSFRNTDTGEEYNLILSMSEREKYLTENKNVEQIITVPNIVDPVNIGVKKPPVDFQKHVLSRARNVPGANKSQIEKRWHIPKEV